MNLVPLSEVAEFIKDGTHGSPIRTETGIPVLSAMNVKDGVLNFETDRYTSNDEYSAFAKRLPLAYGDVLLTIVGTIGRSAVVNEIAPLVFQRSVAVIRPKLGVLDSRFLFHVTQSADFQQQLDRAANKSSQAGVYLGKLGEVEITLPPLPEQRRIAAILDQADVLRAKRREALAQLDILTQSIFIEMFGDPVANPKGFPVRTLGEIIKFEGGSQPPASTFSSEDAPDRIRLVQIRDFKSDRFKTFIPRKLSKRFFDEDDVMIGRYGPPVFQILRGLSGSYNVALMKAVPRDGVTKDFVFHLLKEERLHNFVVANSERTAGQSGVNLELLEKYQAYLPPIELQMQFSRQLAQLKIMVKSMNEAQAESDSLFASLQHRAFRGEL